MNAIKLYRIARFFHEKKIPLVPKIIKGVIFVLYNSVVPYTSIIGRDTKFAYGGIGVVLHGKCVIGNRVVIGQGVTVGRKLDPEGVPLIGDDVYISAGSRVLGGVTVGSNVIIGANSVVISDVPPNCIVAGAPAKIVRMVDVSIYELLKNIY
ncbi:MAG: serine acetyltransferase [Pseudomonas sp.]|uniref:serine O-acetyltransferase n=1 Tax=Pseudomonas sp. TaxID=306 RepID=UPI0027363F70|nr:serine acetyltransferase [Pseudomonas sp.]MDP3846175.1 serine acetyltransferase [Pseudomonas sp.]MDZ4262816.1 serine acetyltransferase [Pseudomonadota bacterium]